jgi:limonene-1,2-epoxide hydrolase
MPDLCVSAGRLERVTTQPTGAWWNELPGNLMKTSKPICAFWPDKTTPLSLLIGDVWKAKSPLELLDLFGGGITRDQWDRFFQVALDVLSLTDPQLELPEEERYAAQVYGKVRPQSGLLFESLCDTLIKLAVRGPENPALLALGVEHRVARLVHDLLDDASESRWLSLASYLPALAEAAPEAFLRAIEKSLSLPNQPVTRLIKETTNSGIGGGCWHARLLWAMETLAWAPKRLARVVLILARSDSCALYEQLVKHPWTQPAIFVSELGCRKPPRHSNNAYQVLDQLVDRDPDAAFDLLDALTERGPQHASYTARPKWRDDDAGTGRGATTQEMHGMLLAARERMFRLSENHAPRLVRLFENMGLSDIDGMTRALALIEPFSQPARDNDREILRDALRVKLHWHRNYDDNQGPELESRLAPVEAVYEALAPENLVIRHRWLFADHWLQLPAKESDDHRDHG